jgi:hypothetical protein
MLILFISLENILHPPKEFLERENHFPSLTNSEKKADGGF